MTVEGADDFLRGVYDWNPYAVGYAIAEARQTVASLEIRTVIFARLDIMLRRAERANDALSLIQSEDVGAFKTYQIIEEIFGAVNAVESERGWFQEWRSLSTTTSGSAATATLRTMILSLVGPVPMSSSG